MLLPKALSVAARVLTGMLLLSWPGPPGPLVEWVTPPVECGPAGEDVMMRGGSDIELTADGRLLALAVGCWLLVAG